MEFLKGRQAERFLLVRGPFFGFHRNSLAGCYGNAAAETLEYERCRCWVRFGISTSSVISVHFSVRTETFNGQKGKEKVRRLLYLTDNLPSPFGTWLLLSMFSELGRTPLGSAAKLSPRSTRMTSTLEIGESESVWCLSFLFASPPFAVLPLHALATWALSSSSGNHTI